MRSVGTRQSKMAFYGIMEPGVSRGQSRGMNERTNATNSLGGVADEIKQQLGDLMKMFKDQREDVSKLRNELKGEISNLQESVASIQK